MEIRIMDKEFIFEDDRPFLSCHASTLLELENGDTLAAWFGGTREKADDVAIWCSLRHEGEWEPPVKVADEEGMPHWNPVLFQSSHGTIYLFYKVGKEIKDWFTRVMTSDDGGRTWTPFRDLVPGDRGGRGPVKNKPIILHNGVWAAPASLEGEYWDAFVDLSEDEGESWTASARVPLDHKEFDGKGIIQPTLWESTPGHVHMLLRSTCGHILRSDSEDGGHTWCPPYDTGLPNNNSGIDVTRLEGGILALVYNPVGQNWGKRTPLVVSLSRDNGETWGCTCCLEQQEGEYSYPAIIPAPWGFSITYTWRRERIAYVRCCIEE